MRTLAIVMLVGGTLNLVTTQGAKPIDSPQALGDWMTFYYQHPDPQRLPDAMQAASRFGFLRGDKTAPPMFGFLAGWFSDNESVADSAVEKLLSLPTDDQPMLIAGLWYADTPASLKTLQKYAPQMPAHAARIKESLTNPSHGIIGIPVEQGPWVLDALWGNFFATGKEAPVLRILTALPWSETKGDAMRSAIGMSAKWSLTSNAVQHPRVLEICRAQLSKQPKDVASVLTAVIKDAEKQLKKKTAGSSAQ